MPSIRTRGIGGRRRQRIDLREPLDIEDPGADDAGGDVDDDRALARVVPVDGPGGQPGLPDDVGHRRGLEPLATERPQRGVGDLVAAGDAVLLGDLGHASL